jgi:hypothetical protein
VEVSLHSFLISALDGGECIASRPFRFIPKDACSRFYNTVEDVYVYQAIPNLIGVRGSFRMIGTNLWQSVGWPLVMCSCLRDLFRLAARSQITISRDVAGYGDKFVTLFVWNYFSMKQNWNLLIG